MKIEEMLRNAIAALRELVEDVETEAGAEPGGVEDYRTMLAELPAVGSMLGEAEVILESGRADASSDAEAVIREATERISRLKVPGISAAMQ